ncbi:anaphase-promoting complex protein [Karstenula rhodostoma CBS 690.94]|uniref:Anaphase-promoting complex subunit 5 n=1 Tax=Karstenula rhodostoma CBS 690.94 TaxID=1392251 RepID=A0A9P4PCN4_9PLEO|nr:anaphase-promoting complex protein [Karstenula rhodostoma CBS 690.94]
MSKPRYLTASKISLLVLVQLYCDSDFPSSATVPVLSFVLSHTFPATPSAARKPHTVEQHVAPLSIRAFEDILQKQTSSKPGRSLLDPFLERLWKMNSIDALFDLFNDLGTLLGPSEEEPSQETKHMHLSPTSPLGALVRQARLEFTRLPFDDIVHLWCAFIAYRAPTAQRARRQSGQASSSVDIVATDLGLSKEDSLFEITYGHLLEGDTSSTSLSHDDLERILEFQLDKLQRLGCRVPEEMKAPLRQLLESSDTVPRQAHLVLFFDAWKSGDYSSAFDNLHRYFDHAMQARERIHYQYALLHMAILQADFGCFGEAIAAINETVATARENQDIHCLNFSLNWLNHMSKAYPKQMKRAGYIGMLGSEREGLAFLKAKARETRTYNLLSATLLNEAKLCLLSGDVASRAFELLYQSSHLSLKENIGNNGSHLLFQSALYSRLGNPSLSEANCQLLLDCYQSGCPLDERIRALGRRAFLEVLQRCRYDEALRLLASTEQFMQRSLKFHQYVYLCTGLVKLRRAIRHKDWTACEVLFSYLQPDSSTDPELTFLLSESRIDYLVARGLYSQAWDIVEELSTTLKEEGGDVMQRISLLIAKADICRRLGRPERGFSVALRAASVAFKAHLKTCLFNAVGLLANILISNADYHAATRLLSAIIPQSLENGDVHVAGALYSHMGDAYMGLAGVEDGSSAAGLRLRAIRVSRAELYIDRARECFKKAEDVEGECEQLMKKAVIARLRGDEELAEEWAHDHNRVWEHGVGRIAGNSIEVH